MESLAADANLPRSLPRDVMGIGFSLGTVNTEQAFIPRSVSGKVYANMFGYDLELLEVYLNLIASVYFLADVWVCVAWCAWYRH